eukprot:g312.t1
MSSSRSVSFSCTSHMLAFSCYPRVSNTLQTLNFCNNNIGSDGAKTIGKALEVNQSIERIYIQGDWIPRNKYAIKCYHAPVNKTLTSLSLKNNGIGDTGTKAIGEALRENSTLRELDVSFNHIGDDGAPEDSQAAAMQPPPLLHQPSLDISSAEQVMIPSSVGDRYSGVIFAPRDLGFGFGESCLAAGVKFSQRKTTELVFPPGFMAVLATRLLSKKLGPEPSV